VPWQLSGSHPRSTTDLLARRLFCNFLFGFTSSSFEPHFPRAPRCASPRPADSPTYTRALLRTRCVAAPAAAMANWNACKSPRSPRVQATTANDIRLVGLFQVLTCYPREPLHQARVAHVGVHHHLQDPHSPHLALVRRRLRLLHHPQTPRWLHHPQANLGPELPLPQRLYHESHSWRRLLVLIPLTLYPASLPCVNRQLLLILKSFRVGLFVLQFGYITHLFSRNADTVNAAASVGSHFILNNLFHFGFVMLFVRSHFHWAELLLILNFINLSSLYFRHHTYPRFIHAPTVSGPLAWTFVAIYWNGAIMVPHQHSLVARIFGNIFIWSILVYGMFFIIIYKVCLWTLAEA